ncbi:MAG: class I SAM-dependent RNA methyltransferase [Planctomycetes bacterium]|nr:class I SAM-dependent RNA methyltransferase [Planctomycetota bacterium]
MTETFALFAACLPGLEPLLCDELKDLGAAPTAVAGGATFQGDLRLLFTACLQLGTASHVVIRVAGFPCRALGELERKAALLPWSSLLRADVPARVRAVCKRSRIWHSGAAEERLENAIAKGLGRAPRRAEAEDPDAAVIAVRIVDDHVTISLDATTTPLHRRGWRLATAKAPLREDLAHALLLASGWQPGQALLDPFCGAGTIAIEAACVAADLAPGRLRPPPCRHLGLWNERLWQDVLTAARPEPTIDVSHLAASDRDAGAIEDARGNAERAGVAAAIEFRCCAVSAQPWLATPAAAPPNGTLVTNPPFGVRVAGGEQLASLYQSLGHRLQGLGAGWRLAMLAYDVRMARRVGRPLRSAFATRIGGLGIAAMIDAEVTAKGPDPAASV